jgi:hypothetical protein
MFETCFDFDANMSNSFKCPCLKKGAKGVAGGLHEQGLGDRQNFQSMFH